MIYEIMVDCPRLNIYPRVTRMQIHTNIIFIYIYNSNRIYIYNISYACDWSYAFSYNPHMHPYAICEERKTPSPPFLDHGAHIVLSEKLLYPVISSAEQTKSAKTKLLGVWPISIYVQGLNEVSMSLICSELIDITGGNVRWCKYRFGPAYFNMQEDPSLQVGSKYTCLFSITIWLWLT